MGSKSKLFDVLWHLVQSILQSDDDTTLRLVQRRLNAERDSADISQQLIDLDDGLTLLDRGEIDEVVKEQETHTRGRSHCHVGGVEFPGCPFEHDLPGNVDHVLTAVGATEGRPLLLRL